MQQEPSSADISAFKHVVVPLGVVIGLGFGHIVTTIARYVANRERVRPSLGHAAWTAIALLWFIAMWWILWEFRRVEVERWSFSSLLFLLLGPAVLYLAVSLLLPALEPGEQLDLGERLDRVARTFFLCLLTTIVWLAIGEIALLRHDWNEPRRLSQLVTALLMGAGAAFPGRRTTTAIGLVVLGLAVIAFLTFRAALA